jgi:hypothetical protein
VTRDEYIKKMERLVCCHAPAPVVVTLPPCSLPARVADPLPVVAGSDAGCPLPWARCLDSSAAVDPGNLIDAYELWETTALDACGAPASQPSTRSTP